MKNPNERPKFLKLDFGPSIYLSPGDTVFPLRCPACGSANYTGTKECVNEDGTFALNPEPEHLRYQRYVKLTCSECHYTYHIRPEGLWYEKALPPMGIGLVGEIPIPSEARNLNMKKETEVGFSRSESLELSEINPMPDLNSPLDHKSWTSAPYVILPKPKFSLVPNAPRPVPIARYQDKRIFELTKLKRYNDIPLNSGLVNSKIILLTGAGFSHQLGFPLTGGFFNKLNESTKASLEQVFEKHPRIPFTWLDDAEILTDLLLRVQRIALLSPTVDIFEKHLHDLPSRLESIFVLGEQHAGNWMSYPPLAHCIISEELYENTKTSHYKNIREILYNVVSKLLLSCYLPPDSRFFNNYMNFLSSLSIHNEGPLPLFTTNFDRGVEEIFKQMGEGSNITTGTTRKIWFKPRFKMIDSKKNSQQKSIPYSCRYLNSKVYMSVKSGKVAIFHLHGCSNWFVDMKTGITCESEAPNAQALELIYKAIWDAPNSLQPASIMPATVKDHYTISPPFNVCYDYFAECLKRTRILVIIGHSLRDETIREMILYSSKVNEHIQFIIVDRDNREKNKSSMSERFRDCIPENKLAFYCGRGFPDCAKDVEEACKSILQS